MHARPSILAGPLLPHTHVGVPKEVFPGEKRVAIAPADIKKMMTEGIGAVKVESGAGAAAGWPDAAYEQAGATIIMSHEEAMQQQVVIKVGFPEALARKFLSQTSGAGS